MTRLAVSALLLLSLAACEQAAITTPPVAVTPVNARTAQGLDIYAGLRRPGAVIPRFRGQTSVEIRAYDRTGSGNSGELTGIPCTVNNDLYRASITTPATILVPNYGAQSPNFVVTCQYGELQETFTAEIVNKTALEREATAGAFAGVLGSVIASTIPDNENDVYTYLPVTIRFR